MNCIQKQFLLLPERPHVIV